MDYYEALPCAHTQGDTVEGAYATLTALPFEDYKNFAIGAIIQNTSEIIFPDDDAIKRAFTNRTRCPFSYYLGFTDMQTSCPPLNEDGGPPSPSLRGIDAACVPGSSLNHIPADWAQEPYVPPYDMENRIPDRAIWRWDEYGPVACTAVCPFAPSFCEYKGIVCDERRLAEEAKATVPAATHSQLTPAEYEKLREEFLAELEDGGTL